MPITLQDINEKIGGKGTPLRKLSLKEKKELKVFLRGLSTNNPDISADLLLRAYLSASEPISSEMKTVEIIGSSLKLNDILKNIKKLSQEKSLINSAAVFKAINEEAKSFYKFKLDLKTMRPIISGIHKWLTWVESSNSTLTNDTEEAVIEQAKNLLIAMPAPKDLNDKTIKKNKAIIYPLLAIVLSIASKSDSYKTYRLSIELISAIKKKFPSLIMNDLLSDEELSKNMEILKNKMLEKIYSFVVNGETEQLIESCRIPVEMSDLKSDITKNLVDIWDSKGATLNENMQSVIRSILFNETDFKGADDFFAKENKSSVKQLAAALISSWDARNDSPRALDSFKILQSVAENFFNLKIRGDVGATVNFNKIAHEVLDKIALPENTKVQVIRPWIELEDKNKKEILIRALVKPCE